LVRDRLAETSDYDLGEIAAEIIKICLDKNSRDNITAMVVQLSSGGDWIENHPPDEMKGYEKLLNEDKDIDDEVRKQYMSFLRKTQFPPEPCNCAICEKWHQNMMQCPCKTVYYCCRSCQKKHWKKHKLECPANPPGADKSSPKAKK